MKKRFPDEVEKILRAGGWTGTPSEQINFELPAHFEIFPAAENVLKEFAGFYYKPDPITGIEFARSEFSIDPRHFEYPADSFEEEEESLGKKLYPIGKIFDYPIDILIADDGVPYSLSEYGLCQDGDTFDDTLISCILGIRPCPNYTLYPVFDRQSSPDYPPVARCEWLLDKPLLPDPREEGPS
ncbi:SUKH-3 domain-containing protein [Luteolibacter sp. LG18]|uniref:SUKH-3 domain-containing protein n=1 Tax=Luteolibacter sp. LG18 TaxID=2819286 RepID=UPI002B2F1292|nr:hypothetical protein llg_26650 [Luteolibacter sp. LG18]